jgi:hypothetical protein
MAMCRLRGLFCMECGTDGIERISRAVGTPASYVGGPKFESEYGVHYSD